MCSRRISADAGHTYGFLYVICRVVDELCRRDTVHHPSDHVFDGVYVSCLQHYKGEADGLCTNLRMPLVKQDGREFKVDARKFKSGGWEIMAKDLTRTTRLGSGQFGGVLHIPILPLHT